MSPADIDALRKLIAKHRATLRRHKRREPIRVTTELLRAGERIRRDAERMAVMAGSTEGLV